MLSMEIDYREIDKCKSMLHALKVYSNDIYHDDFISDGIVEVVRKLSAEEHEEENWDAWTGKKEQPTDDAEAGT